ncbi:hypothetical protein ACFL26_00280 [Patescibacteria group bacterium]
MPDDKNNQEPPLIEDVEHAHPEIPLIEDVEHAHPEVKQLEEPEADKGSE